MTLAKWLRPPLYEQYSKKARDRIERPHYAGFFSLAEAEERHMRLVTGREGKIVQVCLYWLVDESDGIIADAKFQVVGPIALIAAAESASELCLRKNYDQASRISADLLERHLRDRKDMAAFPDDGVPYLNQIISAIDVAVGQCYDIPYAATYDVTPIDEDLGEIPGGIPGWEQMPDEQKLKILDEVVAKEIRPYIELDAGGVKILGIRQGREVRISYEGSCTTCHSSTGSTLSAIQRILRARVHPSLSVVPEM